MNDKILNRIKSTYPEGTRVRLVQMDDPRPVPVGMLGTVLDVDDIGSHHYQKRIHCTPVSDSCRDFE